MSNWLVGDKAERIWATNTILSNMPDEYFIGQEAVVQEVHPDRIYFIKQVKGTTRWRGGSLSKEMFDKSFKPTCAIQENE